MSYVIGYEPKFPLRITSSAAQRSESLKRVICDCNSLCLPGEEEHGRAPGDTRETQVTPWEDRRYCGRPSDGRPRLRRVIQTDPNWGQIKQDHNWFLRKNQYQALHTRRCAGCRANQIKVLK